MLTMCVNKTYVATLDEEGRGGAYECVEQAARISLSKDRVMRGKSNIYDPFSISLHR